MKINIIDYIRNFIWNLRHTLPFAHNSRIFYAKNAERVTAVTNMLADEKSKKIYLEMIKYRQSFKRRDFPFSNETPQYFINEIKLGENEVFVDCGAYIGDTIDEFLIRCKQKYEQIIAFEPCLENFTQLKNKYGDNPKITLINTGVYDKNGFTYFRKGNLQSFKGGGYGGAKILENLNKERNKSDKIEIKMIDSLNLQNVSFVKMDIEGAELNALKGAKETILRDKPKLAISIYHSNDDMIDIAEYINDLNIGYKIYIRHHGKYSFEMRYSARCETILYAL